MDPAIFLLQLTATFLAAGISFGLPNKAGPDELVLPSKTTSEPEDTIVGGYEADIIDHPYQVSFIDNNTYFCGGFIVSKDYILTTGYCALDVDPSKVVLRAGSTWRTDGIIIPIAEVIAHPKFDNPKYDNDVGVMKTVDPIKFTNVIQPIKLAPKGRPMVAGSKVRVSGWGKLSLSQTGFPECLMAVELSVIEHQKCQSVYSVLTEDEWCAGNFIFGGQGPCSGDYGGAATQDGMAVGIVSYSRVCAFPLSPTVFADITAPKIRDFITEHTGL